MVKKLLPEFQQFLEETKIVSEKKIPYYAYFAVDILGGTAPDGACPVKGSGY